MVAFYFSIIPVIGWFICLPLFSKEGWISFHSNEEGEMSFMLKFLALWRAPKTVFWYHTIGRASYYRNY